MTADAVLMALHRQLDADVAPYLRLAMARGEAVEIVSYVGKDGKPTVPTVKVKPGKPCSTPTASYSSRTQA